MVVIYTLNVNPDSFFREDKMIEVTKKTVVHANGSSTTYIKQRLTHLPNVRLVGDHYEFNSEILGITHNPAPREKK